ncbi:hypothetical protein PM082_001992 [Marasmius tenuissimus]|nr:hypothetical protein PM082_001992 [Marasmius tenuissimus]
MGFDCSQVRTARAILIAIYLILEDAENGTLPGKAASDSAVLREPVQGEQYDVLSFVNGPKMSTALLIDRSYRCGLEWSGALNFPGSPQAWTCGGREFFPGIKHAEPHGEKRPWVGMRHARKFADTMITEN